jgi:hypothetical protein
VQSLVAQWRSATYNVELVVALLEAFKAET